MAFIFSHKDTANISTVVKDYVESTHGKSLKRWTKWKYTRNSPNNTIYLCGSFSCGISVVFHHEILKLQSDVERWCVNVYRGHSIIT